MSKIKVLGGRFLLEALWENPSHAVPSQLLVAASNRSPALLRLGIHHSNLCLCLHIAIFRLLIRTHAIRFRPHLGNPG